MLSFLNLTEGITKPVSMSVIDKALSSSESKIVGKDLKPRALSREIEKSVGKKFGIEVTFKFVPSLTKDDMSANAYYDQEDDIEGDPSITIELLMSAENRNGINIDSKGFDALTFNLSKVIAHEMLHKSQASNRGFVKPFKVSFTDPKQEYLGRSDEIEAYAHTISVDLLRNYGSRKDVLSALKNFTRIPATKSPDLFAYLVGFGMNKNNDVLKKLIKKVILYLKELDK